MLPRGMMRRGMMGPAQMGAGMMGPAMMRMMLVLMDTDGDGTVSLSEFQTAHERIFKALDANKDGRLTLQEVQAFFQGQNGATAPDTKPSQRNSSPPEAGRTPPN
jgi:Ca2+-binding EF-hand superfamily protein